MQSLFFNLSLLHFYQLAIYTIKFFINKIYCYGAYSLHNARSRYTSSRFFIIGATNSKSSLSADSPEKMIDDVNNYAYSFPYLFDDTQKVAKSYKAACTPDFFLFDQQHKLYYRGQFDSARPGSGTEVTGVDMRNAADNLLAYKDAPHEQIPSVGCNIKWKQGNQPEYT